jgi:hypothetical protein
MPEIAELTGVRRPVVTTWRRRHADFPAPVAGSLATPRFDAQQVVDWLVDTGRADRAQIEPDLHLHLLAGLAGGVSTRLDGVSPRGLVAILTALICLRHLDDEPLSTGDQRPWQVAAELRDRAAKADPDDLLLRTEIEALPARGGWLGAAADELVEAAWGCRQAYERVLAGRHRLGAADLAAGTLTGTATALAAGLSGAREHADLHGTVRVADPSAGAGDLLVALLDRLGEDATATVAAAESDPVLARLLRRRLAVSGLPEPDWAVHIGGRLPAAEPVPDVLVTRLPYQPKETRGGADPLAGVRGLVEALRPGQTAVVLGPADLLVGALPPYQPAVRTRTALLASGRVEAVINLPGGLTPYRPGYQTAVWVLRREDPSPWQGRVLLADVSDQPLTSPVVEALVWDVVTWRRDGHRPDQHLRAHAAQVAVSELVAPRTPLTTRRPRPLRDLTRGEQAVARALELEADLGPGGDAAAPRPAVHSGLAVREEPAEAPRRTVGALVRDGWLVLRKGNRVAAGDVVGDGQHRVLGAPELTGGTPVGARTVDRGVLATAYPRVELTHPGDVVVTLTPRLGVHLDRDGFAVVEFPARVLRVPPDAGARLTPRVLVALLASLPHAGHPTARAAGAVRAPARLVDVLLPLLSPAEVARLEEFLAAAEARRELARRELDTLDELCRIATTGLVHGTLTLAGAPRSRDDR